MDWRIFPVKRRVSGFLPTFLGDPLAEIALRVHEPDADEWDAEVARFFTMIACQDTQTTAVDGYRCVKTEFSGEVGDDVLGFASVLGTEPTPAIGLIFVEEFQYSGVLSEVRR